MRSKLVSSFDRLGAAEADDAMAERVHKLLLALPSSALEAALDACSSQATHGATTRLFRLFSDLLLLPPTYTCQPHASHLASFFKLTVRRLSPAEP